MRIFLQSTERHYSLSLCCTSRPYNLSQKWSTYINLFSNKCDFIVCSNGGIIPQKYWGCYPYLTYDAPHLNEDYTDLYIECLDKKLNIFFTKFQKDYDRIIFNFRPGLRNRISAKHFVNSELGKNFETYILPTEEAYNKAKQRGFNHGKLNPDLDDYVLDELKSIIGIQKEVTANLWE